MAVEGGYLGPGTLAPKSGIFIYFYLFSLSVIWTPPKKEWAKTMDILFFRVP